MIKVFTLTFDQFNASLLNKSTNFIFFLFEKILLPSNFKVVMYLCYTFAQLLGIFIEKKVSKSSQVSYQKPI